MAKVVKKNHSLLKTKLVSIISMKYIASYHPLTNIIIHNGRYSMSMRTCLCIPSIHIKKLSMAVHISNVSTGRWGQENPRGSLVSQSSQSESSKISVRLSEHKHGRE